MGNLSVTTRRKRRAFIASEEGSVTVEGVIWVPIFFSLLALIVDASMLFSAQDKMLRAVHDASRAYATGRFSDHDAAMDFARSSMGKNGENAVISSRTDDNMLIMQMAIPARDIAAIGLIRAFTSSNVSVNSVYPLDL